MTSASPPPSIIASIDHKAAVAATGDVKAWSALMVELEPLVRWLAVRRAGRHLSAAGHNDLFVRVVDRLRTDNRRGLVEYTRARAHYPKLDFVTYLSSIIASSMADYIRRRPDNERPRHNVARELDYRVAAVGQLDDIGAELAVLSDRKFSEAERRALLLWLHGNEPDEIAAELELSSADEARALLAGAREHLRNAIPDLAIETDPDLDPEIEISDVK